jgi:hypothetical protein
MHDGSETVARRFQVLLLGTMMMQFSRQCASSLFVIMIALRRVVVDVDGREERRGEEGCRGHASLQASLTNATATPERE